MIFHQRAKNFKGCASCRCRMLGGSLSPFALNYFTGDTASVNTLTD